MNKLLLMIVPLFVLPAVALADDAVVEDADDSAGRLDVRSVEVSHPGDDVIRFVVTFYDAHHFAPGDGFEAADGLLINLRLDGRSPWRFKDILLIENPDGGLYGVFRNHQGRETSYVRAWRPDETSLAIDVKRKQLRPARLAVRADWLVQTSYIDRDVCASEPGDSPATCYDAVPDSRFQVHKL